MSYIFLFLGILLMLLSFREVFAAAETGAKPHQPDVEADNNFFHPQRDEVYEELGEKIELLSLAVERVAAQMGERILKNQEQKEDFTQILASKKKLKEFEEIYQDFDAGKNVEELAKQYNRGKGEVQLILSLRNTNSSSGNMPS